MNLYKFYNILDLYNYLSTYVPDLSSILQPLCQLPEKNAVFDWNSQYDTLYQWATNQILQNANTLCYYDPNLPVSLETAVSQSGPGTVLLQHGQPISFKSKALTETQSRYSNIKHEILGVVTGVKHFHQDHLESSSYCTQIIS